MRRNYFSIEIFICKFKDFLGNFKSQLVFSLKAQKSALGLFISFRIMKDFQETINFTLISIKIGFVN